jgi:hypothetical protein
MTQSKTPDRPRRARSLTWAVVTCLALVVACTTLAGAAFAQVDDRDANLNARALGMLDSLRVLRFPPALRAYHVYAFDTVKIPAFRRAYARALAQLPAGFLEATGDWIRLKEATSSPNCYVTTPVGRFVWVSACHPHLCPHNVAVVFDPASGRIAALVSGSELVNVEFGDGDPGLLALARALSALGDGSSITAEIREFAGQQLAEFHAVHY